MRTELPDPCSEANLFDPQRLVANIEVNSVDFILVNFSQTELSLYNPRKILYQLMRKMRYWKTGNFC